MYDIRNMNIWKESSNTLFLHTEKVLIAEGLRREETIMTEKCKKVFKEMSKLVPGVDFMEIKEQRGGRLRFPMYISESLMITDLEVLDLSPRSSNCLHRAGFRTIGELVETIGGSEDLKKIRNCGTKSVNEIMDKLLGYQFEKLDDTKKMKFAKRVVELNKGEAV